MKYLFVYFLLLLPVWGIGMQVARENKLILSMVQNNTRSFYRLSALHLKELVHSRLSLLQKVIHARIEPFFLAERLDQRLPSKEIALEEFSVLKNNIVNQGYIKIENVMQPQDFVFLLVKQKCDYETQKKYSLYMALYNERLQTIQVICQRENSLMQGDKLHTYITIVFNSEKLADLEITVTPQH
jgi:hypothetical protein